MSGPFVGDMYWGNQNMPQGLHVQAAIGPTGELIDISDDIDRTSMILEIQNDTGAATFSFNFLSDIGNQYEIPTNTLVVVDDPDDTYGGGRKRRYFMGYVVEPSDTSNQPQEAEFSVRCSDTGWWEKYPPANPDVEWPLGGLPFVDTLLLASGLDTPGTYSGLTVQNMSHIVPGKHLYVVNSDILTPAGAKLERVEVESVNFSGSITVTDHYAAAGADKVAHVPADRIGDFAADQKLFIQNIDGTHFETIVVKSVDTGENTITFDCINSHNTDWTIMAGSFTATFFRSHPTIFHTVSSGWDTYLETHTVWPDDPAAMSGIYLGQLLWCDDGLLPEMVTVQKLWKVSGVSGWQNVAFDADFGWPKADPWTIGRYPNFFGGPSDLEVLKGPFWSTEAGLLMIHPGAIDEFICTRGEALVTSGISAGTQVVTPTSMDNLRVLNRTVWCQNADGTNRECVTITDYDETTFTATFTLPKSDGWVVQNGPWVDQGGIYEIVPSLAHDRWTYEPFGSIFTRIEAQASDIDTVSHVGVTSLGTPVWATPENMYGISVNKRLTCYNDDGTNEEVVTVLAVNTYQFQAVFTSAKSVGGKPDEPWHIEGPVRPGHYWNFVQDNPDALDQWFPRVHYRDKGVRHAITLLQLTDSEAMDPDTDAPYTTYSIARSGADQYNSVIVRGKNNAWAEYVDWRAVRDLGGRVLQAPPVTNSNLTSNQACYDFGAAIISQRKAAVRTITAETYSRIEPEMFYQTDWVTFVAAGESDLPVEGQEGPISRAVLSFDNGPAKYQIEIGDAPNERLARSRVPIQDVANSLVEGTEWKAVLVDNEPVTLDEGGTTYNVDASDGIVWATLPSNSERWGLFTSGWDRQHIWPVSGGYDGYIDWKPGQTGKGGRGARATDLWTAQVVKIDRTLNDVIIQAPDGHTIDGKRSIKVRFPNQSVTIKKSGNRFYTVGKGPDSPRTVENAEDHIVYTDEAKNDVMHINHYQGKTYFNAYYGDNAYGIGLVTANAGLDVEPDSHTGLFGNVEFTGGPVYSSNVDLTNPSSGRVFVSVDCVSADRTVQLPDMTGITESRFYVVEKTDGGVHTLTISGYGSQKVDGSSSKVLAASGASWLRWTGATSGWRSIGLGGAAAPSSEPQEIEFQLAGADSNTPGRKHSFQVPFACSITGVWLINDADAAMTTTVNLWRAVDGTPRDWDAGALNPSAFGPSAAAYYYVSSFSGWTTSIAEGDWLAFEIVDEDATLARLIGVVEVTPS